MDYKVIKHSPWADLSLVRQFALAGGVVMLAAMLVVGAWVSQRIEEVVVRNTANATALYMESFIAPLTQNLTNQDRLTEEERVAIEALLNNTSLGKRVVSFKIWRKGGLVVDASNPEIVGKTFEVTENLRLAWQGEVRADFEETTDAEDVGEHALGLPLLEIYSPIREGGTDTVIAVAEFYEVAGQLKADLGRAKAMSWAAVAVVMLLIGASLFAVVQRGSRTIDHQLEVLKDLSNRNIALRLRVQGAAARFSAVNDQALRRIGADLHDGPAQLLGFAALRLDALRGHLTTDKAKAELEAVERAVKDAMVEIRNVARGVSLPDIDRKSLAETVQIVVDAHAARTQTKVDVVVDTGQRVAFSMAVKICVYRVVQEGLTNAWRHGAGVGQEVRVVVDGDRLVLSVLDRGPGFVTVGRALPPDEGGMGLAGLTDRVESLGGRVETLTRIGGGAELRVTLDLREEE